MKELIKSTTNWTKMDTLKLNGARSLRDMADISELAEPLVILKAAICNDTNAEGSIERISAIITDQGTFAGNSIVAVNTISDIIDYINDELSCGGYADENAMLRCKVLLSTTKSGKDFVNISIL